MRSRGTAQLTSRERPAVLLVTLDPLGERMAGPAIRCLELARALARSGRVGRVTVASLTGASLTGASVTGASLTGADPREGAVEVVAAADRTALAPLVGRAGAVVVQGDVLGLQPWLAATDVPLVVDAYDPFHLEQLEQARALGEPRRRAVVRDAVRSLNVQLARADLVLCASGRQRALWLGHLAALGRVNPVTYDRAHDLGSLVAVVPFGVPGPARGGDRALVSAAMPGIGPDDELLIWGGGIYDWFDAGTVIRAVGRLAHRRPGLRLLFLGTRHPVQGAAGGGAVAAARSVAAEEGLLDSVVHFHSGWVPYADRDRWLGSGLVGVSAHRSHLETEFSFRTRILDYLWCGLPVVTTAGDELGDLIGEAGAGVAVPEGDVDGYTAALATLLDDDRRRAAATAARALARRFSWDDVARPLVDFCSAPCRAPDLVLGAADRELLGLAVPRRTSASVRARAGATLREGGLRLLAERVARRLRHAGRSG